MGRNLVETLMGAVVLIVAGVFLSFAYSVTNVRTVNGYEVTARFERIDGLNVGADVRLSGIRVGSVIDARLDPETYLAVIRLGLERNVRLPTDSVAQVASEGLLGASFVALVPGGDDAMIQPGGVIRHTQAPVNIVQLLGRIIFAASENPNAGRDAPSELGGPSRPAPSGGNTPQPATPR